MTFTQADRATAVIGYAEAALHLRLADTSDQSYVEALIEDATSYAEGETESTLGTRTTTAIFFSGEDVVLPRGPIQTISSVTDAVGRAITYEFRSVGNIDRLILKSDATFPLTVVYDAGHDPVPGALRRVILAHVAECYDRRTNVGEGQPQPWIARTYAHYRRTPPIG